MGYSPRMERGTAYQRSQAPRLRVYALEIWTPQALLRRWQPRAHGRVPPVSNPVSRSIPVVRGRAVSRQRKTGRRYRRPEFPAISRIRGSTLDWRPHAGVQMETAIVDKMLSMLVPSRVTAAITTTAISARISAYSARP